MGHIRSSVSQIHNINDALEFAFSFRSFGVSIKPLQVKYEIAKLLEIVTQIKPRNLLEIGTANGGTLFLFAIASDPSAKIISVELAGRTVWRRLSTLENTPIQAICKRRTENIPYKR